jgi:hypothetical protein
VRCCRVRRCLHHGRGPPAAGDGRAVSSVRTAGQPAAGGAGARCRGRAVARGRRHGRHCATRAAPDKQVTRTCACAGRGNGRGPWSEGGTPWIARPANLHGILGELVAWLGDRRAGARAWTQCWRRAQHPAGAACRPPPNRKEGRCTGTRPSPGLRPAAHAAGVAELPATHAGLPSAWVFTSATLSVGDSFDPTSPTVWVWRRHPAAGQPLRLRPQRPPVPAPRACPSPTIPPTRRRWWRPCTR